jgi:D-threo-aldose 1-dehydrogenase
MRSYEDSLQRLALPKVDILLLHDIGEMQHGSQASLSHFHDAMTGGYKALEELRRNGDVACIGLGVNEREVCMAALDYGDWDCFLLAGRYTLLEQAPIEDLLPACERAKTSLIIGSPFNSGILAGGGTWNCKPAPKRIAEKAKKLAAVCAAHDVPVSAAAVQFPLGSAIVASVIPGPRSCAQAREIIDWYSLDIPASLWSDLRAEGLLHPDAPTP